jgi:FdhD protein
MRTPGNDFELAIGFLFTEGIISTFDEIDELREIGCNRVEVQIKEIVDLNLDLLDRHSFVASSCGVCGKKSIEAIQVRRNYVPNKAFPKLPANVVHSLPAALSVHQKQFDTTGGIHASALFDFSGQLLSVREDVGRHNALDKLIGAAMQQNLLPLENCIVFVSGRASFELVQKAAHAGVTAMAAVGAPSSLAVELAQSSGMTLLGFVRNNRFNVYTFSQSETA